MACGPARERRNEGPGHLTVEREAAVQSHHSAVWQNTLWCAVLLCSGRTLAPHTTPEAGGWNGMPVFLPNETLSAFKKITVFRELWILPNQQAWVGQRTYCMRKWDIPSQANLISPIYIEQWKHSVQNSSPWRADGIRKHWDFLLISLPGSFMGQCIS